MRKIDISQWLVVIGIFQTNYLELILLLLSVSMLYKINHRIYRSILLFPMMLVFLLSLIIINILGYDYSKPIQQMILLTMFILLYEQFFKFNKKEEHLIALFKKYMSVSYYICIIGIVQEIVFILLHINIFDFLPGYHATHLIFNGILRVTSTLSEGGFLGPAIIPTLIYVFYYKDRYSLLHKSQKFLILIASFLTMSPFVYMFYFLLLLHVIGNRISMSTRRITILSIVICCCVVYTLSRIENYETNGGINHVFSRVHDTYLMVSRMTENDLLDVLSNNENPSAIVIATNMYIGINAPSRILGTGIGTNEQSHSRIVSTYIEEGPALLNADDGYSLFNRILSEFGIIGIMAYVYFLYKNCNLSNSLNVCVFGMLLCLFMRGGNYVLYGTIFVHFFYYYTSKFNLMLKNK